MEKKIRKHKKTRPDDEFIGTRKSLYWCRACGVPLLSPECERCGTQGHRICSDLRPVFPEQKRFLEEFYGLSLPAQIKLLWMRHRTVWFNGYRFVRLSATGKPKVAKVYRLPRNFTLPKRTPSWRTVWLANKTKMQDVITEAKQFVRQIVKQHSERLPVVSFSGGKDSAVVSALVRRALRSNTVLHVFGDTTMEIPDTYRYVKAFQRTQHVPLKVVKSKKMFLEMCEAFDPPTQINPWCCSVFKKATLSTVMNSINDGQGVLSFEGIRRTESTRRRLHERVYERGAIAKQISANPILEWGEFEVWLLIHYWGIPFNPAYAKGFTRVGCLYCPHNSSFTDLLASKFYAAQQAPFVDYLISYARRIGKPDPIEYVSSGAWKTRVGTTAAKAIPTKIHSRPCHNIENATVYYLFHKAASPELIEFFKPLGFPVRDSNSETNRYFIVDRSSRLPLFFVVFVHNSFNQVKIAYCVQPNPKRLVQRVERQLLKYQSCRECGACVSLCPERAINVGSPLRIDEAKCRGCGRCMSSKYLPYSCVGIDALRQRKKGLLTYG